MGKKLQKKKRKPAKIISRCSSHSLIQNSKFGAEMGQPMTWRFAKGTKTNEKTTFEKETNEMQQNIKAYYLKLI